MLVYSTIPVASLTPAVTSAMPASRSVTLIAAPVKPATTSLTETFPSVTENLCPGAGCLPPLAFMTPAALDEANGFDEPRPLDDGSQVSTSDPPNDANRLGDHSCLHDALRHDNACRLEYARCLDRANGFDDACRLNEKSNASLPPAASMTPASSMSPTPS